MRRIKSAPANIAEMVNRRQPDKPTKNKTVVKCTTSYNNDIESKYTINDIGEFKELYKQLKLK
jgi:hypothetical protein